MSLCPKGIVMVTLEISEEWFEHTFIVCQNLQQPLLFGMDFTQNYRIDTDRDHNSVSYLRHQGRKLIPAWPNSSIPDSEASHVTDVSVALVTDGLGIRLKIPAVVTIPPHSIIMIPLSHPSGLYTAKESIPNYSIHRKAIVKHITAISVNIAHAPQI